MGRPPAYLFVVRHGNRLDAADKQWHLSSPTPYDPPLTYGGWQQAKALGARIGAILHDRIQQEGKPPKRYKIVLHSSPFLRCVQTSIAVAAGIAQDPSPLISSSVSVQPPASGKPHKTRKSTLRLDAFLGEWLSPGYFEFITPPPSSFMMLAGAKSDLLRPENYQSYPHFDTHAAPPLHGFQLWDPSPRSSPTSATTAVVPDGLEDMASLSGSLPAAESPGTGYISPVPNYAVSSSSTIPMGYVSHARDACVDIDYQWDSSRSPLAWGDGGSFGEEWTSMHQRFRRGIQRLVDWYAVADAPTNMVTKTAQSVQPVSNTEDDGVETEAVVVMVSHGAGCNALIGAITHQPVLMDVGTASLTMACRKPDSEVPLPRAAAPLGSSTTSDRDIAGTLPIHQHYDLRLFANTDHLRPATTSSPVSASPSPAQARGRFSSFSGMNNLPPADGHVSRSSSVSGTLHSMRRPSPASQPPDSRGIWGSAITASSSRGGITVGSGVTSFARHGSPLGLNRAPSIGLWSPIGGGENRDDDDMLLNFSHEKRNTPSGQLRVATSNEPAAAAPRTAPPRTASPLAGVADRSNSSSPRPGAGGLWAGGPRAGEAERADGSFKRRWTVDEG